MKRLAALLMAVCLLALAGLACAGETAETARTNCDANVRKGPSVKNDILFKLEKGTEVRVNETIEDGNDTWCYITVVSNARVGYILRSLLDFGAGDEIVIASEQAAQALAVWRAARTKCEVNVRKTPAQTGAKIGELAALTDLQAGETADGWTRIKSGATEGYVQANLLDYAPEGAAEAAPQPEETAQAAEPQPSAETGKRYPDGTNLSRRIDSSYYYYLISGGDAGETPALFDDETLAQYSPLTVGDTGDAVLAVKDRLTELGYYKDYLLLGPDYTESTTEYVRQFQRVNGLDETGDADPETQALLFSEYALRAGQKAESDTPIEVTGARLVGYNGASAVQIEFKNRTGEILTGFTLKIIPYSAYGEPTGLASTLAEQAARSYEKKMSVSKGGTYSDSQRGHYFVIAEDEYFAGALVTVAAYSTSEGTVQIDSDNRSWFAAGTANLADAASARLKTIRGMAKDEANEWDMGFACEYVLPVYRRTYSAPEGLAVTAVEPSNYGEWAGLEPGDVLLAMDTTALTSTRALENARRAVNSGDTFELVFWRDGLYYAATLQR